MSKEAYSKEYYQTIAPGSSASAEEVIPVVCSFFKPESVIDIGCGVGTWLAVWQQNGINDYLGLDGAYVNKEQLRIPPDKFKAVNLQEKIASNRKYELIMSLEVAEHIRPQHASTFISSLCSFGDIVLFSAAIPGQGGIQHVNEQYPDYWINLFAQNGFTGYDCLRSQIWLNKKIDTCYRQNLLFFVRNEVRKDYESITKHQGPILPLVHPEHFQKKEEILISYKHAVRTPFHAGWHFLKKWLPFLKQNE